MSITQSLKSRHHYHAQITFPATTTIISTNNSICKGVEITNETSNQPLCVAKSIYNTPKDNDEDPVYADATCAKFNTASKKCINNQSNDSLFRILFRRLGFLLD